MAHFREELRRKDAALLREVEAVERRWQRARRESNVMGHLFAAAESVRTPGGDTAAGVAAVAKAFFAREPLVVEMMEEEAGRRPPEVEVPLARLAEAICRYVGGGRNDADDMAVRAAWGELNGAFKGLFDFDLLDLTAKLEEGSVIG